MKTEHIKALVQSFYQGETTVEEEQELLRYFERKDVPEDLLEEKELFLRLYQPSSEYDMAEIPANAASRLSVLIDQLAEKEEVKPRPKTKRLWVWVSSAAACVVILIASTMIYKMQTSQNTNTVTHQDQPKGVITDPDQAAIEVRKAMTLVSEKLSKGTEQLALVSENMEKVNQVLNKQSKRINNNGKKDEN